MGFGEFRNSQIMEDLSPAPSLLSPPLPLIEVICDK